MTTKYTAISKISGVFSSGIYDTIESARADVHEGGFTSESDTFGAHSVRYVFGNDGHAVEAWTDFFNGTVGIFEVEVA
jgi:hypothetical protein